MGGWSARQRIHLRQRIVNTKILMVFSYIKPGLRWPVLARHFLTFKGVGTKFRHRVTGGKLSGNGTYIRYLIHQ